ncbi:uncharacterized protein LOC116848992 [Odontomachus brunneus]|uniref:uncharacterized protein LOC116848992 n=1 Tax=Odontomachus brunneus TaxID=486640 RepID=UPI0013F18D64|nr:uncharacterized protein LOC116848992 [Odontomachus brunneus]
MGSDTSCINPSGGASGEPTMRWIFRCVSAAKGAPTRASRAQTRVLWILPPSWVSVVSGMVLGLAWWEPEGHMRALLARVVHEREKERCASRSQRVVDEEEEEEGIQHRNDTSDGLGRPSAQRDLADYTEMSKPVRPSPCRRAVGL